MKSSLIKWILLIPSTIIATVIIWNLTWYFIAPLLFSSKQSLLFKIILSGLMSISFILTPTKVAPSRQRGVFFIFSSIALILATILFVINLNGIVEFTFKKVVQSSFELWGASLGFTISLIFCSKEIEGR